MPESAPNPPTAKAVLLLGLAALFAYYNSLHGAFVFDDFRFVADPNIASPFSSTLKSRPVVAVSLALNYRADGLNPRGYHVLNLAVHVLAAVVLFDLVRRTLQLPRFGGRFDSSAGWVGLAAAAVWLVHPLNTQSVTYVVQRCESMMGMFFLVAFWSFLRGAQAERRGGWWYALAFAAALLGVGCKEMMVAFPPLLLLFDRTFLAGSWRESLRARWRVHMLLAVPPLIGVGVVFATGLISGREGTVGSGVALFTPWSYALTQTEVILHYLRLAAWPRGLTLDYLDWPARQSLREVWPTALGLGALLAVTLVGVVKNRAWSFPAAWFFVTLAPTSSFVPIQDAAFEHRMYLPLVGVVLLAVTGLVLVAPPRAAAVVLAAAVVVLGFVTVVRNEDYASRFRLVADNVASRPENARARGSYAELLRQAGRPEEAEAEMRVALSLPRVSPGDRTAFSTILNEAGKTDEAVVVARHFHESEPENAEFRRQYGFLLLVAGRSAEAVPHLKAVVEKDPADRASRLHLAIALSESGQPADAAFAELRERSPGYAKELSATARRTGVDPGAKPQLLRMAVQYAAAAVRMGHTPDDALDTLAVCLARVGRFDEAAKTEEWAIAAAGARDEYHRSLMRTRLDLYRAKKPFLPESFPAPKRAGS